MNDITSLYKKVKYHFNDLAPSSSFWETSKSLRIDGSKIVDEDSLGLLIEFEGLINKYNLGELIVQANIFGEINLKDIDIELLKNDKVDIVLNKPDTKFFFFSPKSFYESLLKEKEILKTEKVWINADFPPFSTYTTWYLPFLERPPYQVKDFAGLRDTRQLVKNLCQNYSLPHNIGSLLLYKNPKDSKILRKWKSRISFLLALCIPLQISCNDSGIRVILKDERFHTYKLTDKQEHSKWLENHKGLSKMVNWIYKTEEESESKHTLVNYHLALESNISCSWPNLELIEKALTSAKQAYKLHLQETSREVLKSLGELRKTLFDEVEKVKDSTRSVIEKLWRDFAIVLGVILIRFVANFDQLPDLVFEYLAYGTSGFLILSISVTVVSNFFFHKSAKKNRDEWKKRLYFYISEDEFQNIYQQPITRNLCIYRIVVIFTFLVYLCLSGSLFYSAFCDIL